MRWKYETLDERDTRLGKWHYWFAWHPVYIDGHMVWLETVERCGWWGSRYDGGCRYDQWMWRYRHVAAPESIPCV